MRTIDERKTDFESFKAQVRIATLKQKDIRIVICRHSTVSQVIDILTMTGKEPTISIKNESIPEYGARRRILTIKWPE